MDFFLLIILLGFVSIPVYRARAVVRVAGMSETTPVCSKCHYRLGGWASSKCPECGVDVCKVGVRIGPKTNQLVLGIIIFIITLLVAGPLAVNATDTLFETKRKNSGQTFKSKELPHFLVVFETLCLWYELPTLYVQRTKVQLLYFNGQLPSVFWMNGAYLASPAAREQTIVLTEESNLETDLDIEARLKLVLGPFVDEEVLKRYAQSIENLTTAIVAAQTNDTLDEDFMFSLSDDMLRASSGSTGSGSGYIPAFAWPRIILTISIFVAFGLFTWFVLRVIKLANKPSWRLPHDDEWENISSSQVVDT